MLKKLLICAAFAGAVSAAGSVSAATYVSNLEYKNTAPNTQVALADIFGTVTLTEISPNSVDVLVHLISPQVGFLNSGDGKKAPFSFNLTGDYDVVTYNDTTIGQQFEDGGFGAFQNNNFGIYTNKINCCGGVKGATAYDPTDLHFIVTNTALGGTLTFAGVDATFGPDNHLLTTGTGPRFLSTVATNPLKGASQPGGFWFAADVVGAGGNTFTVAARDAVLQIPGGVPEPSSWALMIMGFGGVGAVLRSRPRSAAVQA